MAVAFSAGTSNLGAVGTTLTLSLTCPSSAFLVVIITAGSDIVSGVTYNGVAMTRRAIASRADAACIIYTLATPDVGTYDVIITKTGGARIIAHAACFTGVTGFSATGTATGSSGAPAVTVTTAETAGMVVAGFGTEDVSTATYNGDGTQFGTGDGDILYGAAAYDDFSGGADVVADWSITGSHAWAAAGIELYSSGTEYSQGCTETITLVDTLAKTPSRALTEAVALVDTLVKTPGKALSDVVTLVDTLLSARTLSKALDEAVTLVDTVVKSATKALSEVVTLVDTVTSQSVFIRAFEETVTLVDTVTKTAGKALSDAIEIGDSLVKTAGKVLSDTATLVDTVARSIGRSLSDTTTLVDTVTKAPSKVLGETITLVARWAGTLNGIATGLWEKTARVTSTWDKIVRVASSWDKIVRKTSNWNKTHRP